MKFPFVNRKQLEDANRAYEALEKRYWAEKKRADKYAALLEKHRDEIRQAVPEVHCTTTA